MFNLLIGFIAGVFTGFLFGQFLPIEFFIIAILVLIVLSAFFFFIFHLGLHDFQEY